MNALSRPIAAMSMPCVTIPKDPTNVHAKPDILEMEKHALVVSAFLWALSI